MCNSNDEKSQHDDSAATGKVLKSKYAAAEQFKLQRTQLTTIFSWNLNKKECMRTHPVK